MTPLQRTIKAFAIALAMVIIIGICGSVISALSGITLLFSRKEKESTGENSYAFATAASSQESNTDELYTTVSSEKGEDKNTSAASESTSSEAASKTPSSKATVSKDTVIATSKADGKLIADNSTTATTVRGEVHSLDIELEAAKLEIAVGDKLTVSTNNKNITVKEKNGELEIKEQSKKGIKLNTKASSVKVTVPKNMLFNSAEIESGAGTVKIERLCAKEIELDVGAGEMKIDYINATQSAKIDTGAGKLTIADGILNDLELELGVGETKVTGALYGNCDIEQGVGKLTLNLKENKDQYKFSVKKSVGTVKIDGTKAENKSTVGNGKNLVDIETGVGSVTVNFK